MNNDNNSDKNIFTLIDIAIYAAIAVMISALIGLMYLTTREKEAPPLMKTLTLIDTVGGNERYLEQALPEDGDPLPLPNPSVFQKQESPASKETIVLTLQPEEQTEVKLLMQPGQTMMYSWKAENGSIYVDFHGHEVDEDVLFVRYEELDEGIQSHGTLSAPFAGEHGWYWVNLEEQPVTITLDITGYFDNVIRHETTSISPF